MAEALSGTDFTRFASARIAGHAQAFSADAFKERLTGEVERLTGVQAPFRTAAAA
jgi:hypothetical protein